MKRRALALTLATLTLVSNFSIALADRGMTRDVAVTINHNKDITGYKETSKATVSGSKTSIRIDIDQKLKNVSNTVVLDLAKFSLRGLPYEMELMEDLVKDTPEHYYGDIIHIEEQPYQVDTRGSRSFLPFEQQLIEGGIVRNPNPLTYIIHDKKFSVDRDTKLTTPGNEKITRSDFLGSLGRVNGIIDNVIVSTKSFAVTIPGIKSTGEQVRGRETIDTSPYLKHLPNGVDTGQNIVLVDYSNGEYIINRLDNIYKPYLNYLLDINVINKNEIKGQEPGEGNEQDNGPAMGSIIRGSDPKKKKVKRMNYEDITVSTPPINPDSSKDWDWGYQITKEDVSKHMSSAFVDYNLNEEYTVNKDQKIVDMYGKIVGMKTEYIPNKVNFMNEEKLTQIEALNYIYKYLVYNEKEVSLNRMEVDTIISLYGLELSKYSAEEVKMLNYLIVKGILDPLQDNLLNLREGLLYEDMVKFLFRLKYEDKRFDFKTLSLSMQDLEMANNGYMQDNFEMRVEEDTKLERSKMDFLTEAAVLLDKKGEGTIHIELPTDKISYSTHILSDSKKYDMVFPIAPVKRNNKIYGYVTIPKGYDGDLVLRSTEVGNTATIILKDWEDSTLYNIDPNGKHYVAIFKDNKVIGTDVIARGLNIDMRTFLANSNTGSGNAKFQLDPNRKGSYLYNRENLFIAGTNGALVLNPKFEETLGVEGDFLVIKNIQDMTDAMKIVSNLDIPATLSNNDIIFGGYSQIISNGSKVSLIRDLEMNKLGIEVLEDNVLYNPKLDTYAYLDLRTDTMYYGNTIVRYEPNTMLVDGINGHESTFYNLDVVKTILTKTETNGSVANEIITHLPKDELYKVVDPKGNLMNNAYLHKETASKLKPNENAPYWLNIATLGGKNSNFIYFRDKANGDFSMMINFRVKNTKEDLLLKGLDKKKVKTNNNSFLKLLETFKMAKPTPHEGINPIFQAILAYKGNFTDSNYNYGINLLFPEKTGSASDTAYRLAETQKAFYQFQNMFTNEEDKEKFALHLLKTGGYTALKMSSIEGETQETLREYMDRLKGSSKYKGYKKHHGDLFLGSQEYNNKTIRVNKNLPIKIGNNTPYVKFKNFSNRSEMTTGQFNPYSSLGTLRYLYNANHTEKKLTAKEVDILYKYTPKGYIPLEQWRESYAINPNWGKVDNAVIELPVRGGTEPLMFDRIRYRDTKDPKSQFVYKADKTERSHKTTLLKIYSEIKEQFPDFKELMEHTELEAQLLKDTEALEKYLGKTIVGTDGSLIYREKGKSPWDFIVGALPYTPKTISEKDLVNDKFNFKKGTAYKYDLQFVIPSGTMLVHVGEQVASSGIYTTKEGNYKLVPSISSGIRVEDWEINDIVNQSIASIFDTQKIGEIKTGSLLSMPSGLKLVALGGNQFVSTIGEELGRGVDNEVILMWKYLDKLNQKVGLNSNVLNGVSNIRIPTKQEYEDSDENGLTQLMNNYMVLTSKRVVYTVDTNLKTGKHGKTLSDDKDHNTKALMFPIITLDDSIAVAKIFKDENGKDHYIMKDLSMSVDQKFVNYLKAGVTNISKPGLKNSRLEDFEADDNMIEAFRRRNLGLIIGRIIARIMYIIPWILIVYGVLSGSFILLMSIVTVRDSIEYWLPEWLLYRVTRIFTLFTSSPEEEIYLLQGMLRSSGMTALGILWLSFIMSKYF